MSTDLICGFIAGIIVSVTVFMLVIHNRIPKWNNLIYEPPNPCNGPAYRTWTDNDYFDKITEEVQEVWEALQEYRKNPCKSTLDMLMLECTDVKTVVTSFQEHLGVKAATRSVYQHIVNQTNKVRDDGRRVK